MPIGPRRAALVAGTQGIAAYRDGRPVTSCPYDVTRPLARRAFAAGFAAARRAAGEPDAAQLEEHLGPVDAPWPGDAAPTDRALR